jgi:protein gp37
MGETSIEWTNYSFNPWWGCARVSAGCRNCYAETAARRYGHDTWGSAPRRFFGDRHWHEPLTWARKAAAGQGGRLVFCASMADVFEVHPDLPAQRSRLWELIEATPELVWQLLTKRPENARLMTPWVGEYGRGAWPENVWLGTSVEDQARAEQRVPELLAAGAVTTFVSAEPLLGPLDLTDWMRPVPACPDADVEDGTCTNPGNPTPECHVGVNCPQSVDYGGIGWVIAGGETGARARPMHPAWVTGLRDQCVAAGVPFFFKQWGAHRPARGCELACALDCGHPMVRTTKKAAGRVLDGRTWSELPELPPLPVSA